MLLPKALSTGSFSKPLSPIQFCPGPTQLILKVSSWPHGIEGFLLLPFKVQ